MKDRLMADGSVGIALLFFRANYQVRGGRNLKGEIVFVPSFSPSTARLPLFSLVCRFALLLLDAAFCLPHSSHGPVVG
jgi:hypothetical protein